MKRVLCPTLPRPGEPRKLTTEEAQHLLRVLRLENGALVQALDGGGRSVIARLSLRSGDAWLEFDAEAPTAPTASTRAVLEASVLKGDAMEWVVEKAVELGVGSLVPVLSQRTIVQMQKKGPETFQSRWQKIADQALKQCGRLDRMPIETPVTLPELLARKTTPGSTRWYLDESAGSAVPTLLSEVLSRPPPGNGHLLIGPEGGWTEEERILVRASGGKSLTLGPLVLRAETAAIAAVSIVTAALRETFQAG